MKHKGCKTEFQRERDNDLYRAYREVQNTHKAQSMHQIVKKVVSMPSKRFWVSPERATCVVTAILKNKPLPRMMPTRKEMFIEITNRVRQLIEQYPKTPVMHLVEKVIYKPAPHFYLTPKTAYVLLYKIITRQKRCRKLFRNNENPRRTSQPNGDAL